MSHKVKDEVFPMDEKTIMDVLACLVKAGECLTPDGNSNLEWSEFEDALTAARELTGVVDDG